MHSLHSIEVVSRFSSTRYEYNTVPLYQEHARLNTNSSLIKNCLIKLSPNKLTNKYSQVALHQNVRTIISIVTTIVRFE